MKDYLNMYEVDENGCWLFTGFISPNGYGMCRGMGAHRYSYIENIGHIPDGMQIDHLCHDPNACAQVGRNCMHRRCVNPAHLAVATPRENSLRSGSPAARYAKATHCAFGHPYAVRPTQRMCPTCDQRRRSARRELLAAAA